MWSTPFFFRREPVSKFEATVIRHASSKVT
jgi:hypothetical protein